MQKKRRRVSLERVIAGPGFSAMYDFLIESGRRKESALMKRRLAGADDRNAVISFAGMHAEDRTASMVVSFRDTTTLPKSTVRVTVAPSPTTAPSATIESSITARVPITASRPTKEFVIDASAATFARPSIIDVPANR